MKLLSRREMLKRDKRDAESVVAGEDRPRLRTAPQAGRPAQQPRRKPKVIVTGGHPGRSRIWLRRHDRPLYRPGP